MNDLASGTAKLVMVRRTAGAATVALFTLTVFLSASLLFIVQPMFAKMILPLLGGTPAVWTTCMVFFQACLLVGYGYAHLSTKLLGVKKQTAVHLLLLLTPLLVLPIAIPAGWEPPAMANPVGWLLLLLTVAIGLPFIVVATSSPLLQRWFAATDHPQARDPYFLYAASNLGSMLALVSYPVLFEPLLRLTDQSRWWTGGYALLVGMTVLCATTVWRARHATLVDHLVQNDSETISWAQRLMWIAQAFVPSSYLLGVTTYITTDVAAVPLFWVVPLALYLLSFILVFARRQLIPHQVWVIAMPIAVVAVVLWMLSGMIYRPAWLAPVMHLLAFFVVAMVLHGGLARRRPHPTHLTEFYLLMSLGGVLGGLFNAIVAPLVFTWAVEYPIAIVLACLLMPRRAPSDRRWTSGKLSLDLMLPIALLVLSWSMLAIASSQGFTAPSRVILAAVPVLICFAVRKNPMRFGLCVAAIFASITLAILARPELIYAQRTFFGVHRVQRSSDRAFHELYHGATLHGKQHVDPATGRPKADDKPLTYYHPEGPIGQVFAERVARPNPGALANVALVGLGVGSLAGYGQQDMTITCYEIDPAVVWIAEQSGHFSYIGDARSRGAKVSTIVGDARLTLQRAGPASYDLIVLDAFSGDSIPIHLLTREAIEMYVEKLRGNGVIAIHISNQYLNLQPVCARLADELGLVCLVRDDRALTDGDRADGREASTWVVLARDETDIGVLAADPRWKRLASSKSDPLWVDDRSDILSVFK